MRITVGTIEHIRDLALSRQDRGLSEAGNVELFDSIDCLGQDELGELYAVACVGQSGKIGGDEAVGDARGRGASAAEYLFGLGNLGTYLAAGAALLKLE
ncbi:hypothetical protein RugamoR57_09850 [Duganella caerulea]|uniref:hypothetical protein n=1 Tax=Duganella caerulea TaxID=2885762 RepID=UPI0030E77A07